MKKQKTEFGIEVSAFTAETGLTIAEIAERSEVKRTTLVAAMSGKTPGHDVVPAVRDFMGEYKRKRRKGAAKDGRPA